MYRVDDVCSAKSLMKIRKSSGPNTELWDTPGFTAAASDSDISPSRRTYILESNQMISNFFKVINETSGTLFKLYVMVDFA